MGSEDTSNRTTTPAGSIDAETVLAMNERHVREGEARVSRQEAILAELQRDGHTGHIIELGNELLETLRTALELAREDLERARQNVSQRV